MRVREWDGARSCSASFQTCTLCTDYHYYYFLLVLFHFVSYISSYYIFFPLVCRCFFLFRKARSRPYASLLHTFEPLGMKTGIWDRLHRIESWKIFRIICALARNRDSWNMHIQKRYRNQIHVPFWRIHFCVNNRTAATFILNDSLDLPCGWNGWFAQKPSTK